MENKIPKIIFEEKGMAFLYTAETIHNLSLAVSEISEVWNYIGVFVGESGDKHYLYVSSLCHYIGELDIALFLADGVIEFTHCEYINDLLTKYLDK